MLSQLSEDVSRRLAMCERIRAEMEGAWGTAKWSRLRKRLDASNELLMELLSMESKLSG